MLDHKGSAPQEQNIGPDAKQTHLEGIREKVFTDRYSLKDATGKPLEDYPEVLWARVARGIAEVEETEEQKKLWEKRFYEILNDFKFVPGGRILAGAGSGHQVTFYNCYVISSPEDSRQGILDNLKVMTEIMARGGGVGINLSTLRPRGSYIRTVNGTASGPCSWAQLYSVATGDVIQQGGCFGPGERISTNKGLIPASELADRLDSGEYIQAQTHKGPHPFTAVFRNGQKDLYEVRTARGYNVRVTLDHKMGVLRAGEIITIPLRDLKIGDEILLLSGESTKAGSLSSELIMDQACTLGTTYGQGSNEPLPEALFRSSTESVQAFIQGYRNAANQEIASSNRDLIQDLQQILLTHGTIAEISSEGPIYHLNVTKTHNPESVRVPASAGKQISGRVALLEKPADLSQVLSDAIASITPLGISEVFDFEVEEVHLLSGGGVYTSNSRRGALMLMLDDDHPDVEEFITVKRQSGKIEHANLSVAISDRFMEAVKNDADWDLVWQGKVMKTIRAKELWDLICTSAWESAEPGMVFMDRCNTEANTWYYEKIRCVNPCVTGDTLVSTENGYTYARDLQLGMKVRTPAGLKPIEKLYNNGLQKIYRVDFSDGAYLRGTADHKLKVVRDKKYQWVPLSELSEGDNILVVPNETFGPRQSLPRAAQEYIARRELTIADYYDRNLGLIIGTTFEDGAVAQHVDLHMQYDELTLLLTHAGITPHVEKPQKAIPTEFLSMEKEFLVGMLNGLFSTHGSVLMEQDNPTLRFHTSSYELAQQVRLILLQFGIHGHIHRALPDGNLESDGRSPDRTSEKFDVIVMNEGIARFYSEIGLSHPEKSARLKEIAENWHYNGGTWTAGVVSIEDTGIEEEVYDLYEPETLTWITNGYCSFDCGEQPLPPYGVCNLGAINLSAFVQEKQFDYAELAETSRVAMRFLDNVIDANEYFIEENRVAQLGTRRTGLGTMGLADALLKMEVAYGSDQSLEIIERIYTTIRDAAYEASSDIAVEKGAFSNFDQDKFMQGKFIQRLPKPIQQKISTQGIRNAVILTQAPTGTTSLLAGVSSGIEPVYDFAMVRRDRTGEHILYHPLLQEWRDQHPNEPTPGYFVASNDLKPEEHVRVQATIQKYTDSSISKTVNAPNNHTVEDVQKLYRMAYEMGCKGITYYRDGSRDAVLTRVADEQKAKEPAQPETQPVLSIQQGIKPRPAVVQGYTRQVNSPEGKVNITVNSDENGPLEVFVNVGKAGSDIAALAEALGRLISLNLRVLSPISQSDRVQEIAEQLRGIGGSRTVGFGPQQVRSLPDAVARALEQHIEITANVEQATSPIKAIKQEIGKINEQESSNDGNYFDSSEKPTNFGNLKVTGNLCPQCGSNTMVYEEGCRKCYSCGHSEC